MPAKTRRPVRTRAPKRVGVPAPIGLSHREDRRMHHCYEDWCPYFRDGTTMVRAIPAPVDPALRVRWVGTERTVSYPIPEFNIH